MGGNARKRKEKKVAQRQDAAVHPPRDKEPPSSGSSPKRNPNEGPVLMKCPSTGKFVPTGIYSDVASFQELSASGNQTQCSACGQMHTWGDNEIVLDN